MNKSSSGVVLLTVLVILQCIMLFGLLMLHSAKMSLSNVRHHILREKRLLFAEQILHNLDKAVMLDDFECLVPAMSGGSMMRLPPAWWQLYACHAEASGLAYDYIQEKLGEDACAVIDNNQNVTVIYSRISLHLPPTGGQGGIMLQSTVMTAMPQGDCKGSWHRVHLGRSSWRLLTEKRK